jgi:hypothetical protein
MPQVCGSQNRPALPGLSKTISKRLESLSPWAAAGRQQPGAFFELRLLDRSRSALHPEPDNPQPRADAGAKCAATSTLGPGVRHGEAQTQPACPCLAGPNGAGLQPISQPQVTRACALAGLQRRTPTTAHRRRTAPQHRPRRPLSRQDLRLVRQRPEQIWKPTLKPRGRSLPVFPKPAGLVAGAVEQVMHSELRCFVPEHAK